MTIQPMELALLNDYAALFCDIFNRPPWNDRWTVETARRRLLGMMDTRTFVGLALMDGAQPHGFILGQLEQFDVEMHFQIQEFGVHPNCQGQGCGKALLNALWEALAPHHVAHVHLMTCRGPATEGFYQRCGFDTSGTMIVMARDIPV